MLDTMCLMQKIELDQLNELIYANAEWWKTGQLFAELCVLNAPELRCDLKI